MSDELPAETPTTPFQLGIGIAGGGPGVSATVEMDGEWTVIVLTNVDMPISSDVAAELRKLIEAVERGAG